MSKITKKYYKNNINKIKKILIFHKIQKNQKITKMSLKMINQEIIKNMFNKIKKMIIIKFNKRNIKMIKI